MARLPKYTSFTALQQNVPYLLTGLLSVPGDDVTITSGETVAASPTYRILPGTVIGLRTSTGKYLLADDSNVDTAAAATVRTAITNPGSGGWDGNLVITGHWGSLTVALSGDNTDAAVAAAVIAAAAALNPESQAPITSADEVADSEVSFTNTDVGGGTWIKVEHASVATMMGTGGADDEGTDAIFLVTSSIAELEDAEGTAKDELVSTLRSGDFDTSVLLHLTAEAKVALINNGSRFD